MPQYVGAVRLMVVAGHAGAWGAAEKAAFVRRPLMLLATLPRVLGPGESVALPVSVFALEPNVKDVALRVTTSVPLEVAADVEERSRFNSGGRRGRRLPPAHEAGNRASPPSPSRATSGTEKATQKIELDVRSSTARTTDVLGGTIKPGKNWTPAIALPGLAGTNQAMLEVSRVPPMDLGRRLEYLIEYPHGCVEQTVSAAFPQLYLDKLLELTPERPARVQTNVKAALERLRRFQATDGGFGYWPGDDDSADWATNYAGHFAVEARRPGYLRRRASSTSGRPSSAGAPAPGCRAREALALEPGQAELTQAYRLYTLALAGRRSCPP